MKNHRVSIYGTGMIVEYFDNNEWISEIIGRIISYDLVIYIFIGIVKRNVTILYFYTKYNRWS